MFVLSINRDITYFAARLTVDRYCVCSMALQRDVVHVELQARNKTLGIPNMTVISIKTSIT